MSDAIPKRRVGRPSILTSEEKAERKKEQDKRRSVRSLERRTAARAARALSEGRIPGKSGSVKRLTDEEAKQSRRAAVDRHKAANLEKVKAYQAEHGRQKRAAKAIADGRQPGVIGSVAKLTAQERLERRRQNNASWWQNNPGKRKELADAYYETHKYEAIQRSRKRRAKKATASGSFTTADVQALREKQKDKCAWCLKPFGKKTPHVDHYVPLSRGGTNDPSNLRLLHATCNLSKGAKDPLDFAFSKGLLCW